MDSTPFMERITIAFAGGGTGGHIYPGLAVAEAVRAFFAEKGRAVRIVWIASRRPLDRGILEGAVTAEGERVTDAVYTISSGKLRRYLSLRNITDAFMVVKGFFDSVSVLRRERPSLLFSKGGFVSVPPCAASRFMGIKVYTHECDYTAGLATRLNAIVAKKILLTYGESAQYIKQKYRDKTAVTGNPVRSAFYDIGSKSIEQGLSFLGIKEKTKPVVLFIGGSLGAQEINVLVRDNIKWLCKHFIVVHQTGEGKEEAGGIVEAEGDYHPFPFIHKEMASVMASSDVIVSRAGANSIWECAVLKKCMVLLPLSGEGTRGDQVDNAKYFERMGAAVALTGKENMGERLRAALMEMTRQERRKEMEAKCAEMTAGGRSADIIAQMIYDECMAGKA